MESSPSLPGPVGGVGCCTLIKEEKSKRKWDLDVVKRAGNSVFLEASFWNVKLACRRLCNNNVEHLHFYFPKNTFLFLPSSSCPSPSIFLCG